VKRAAIAWAVAASLAACSPAQDATQPTGAFASSPNARGHSWMLPEARSENLLYIGDPGSGGVLVYSYLPSLKFVGVLSEPPVPGGECVDAAQDVFVTDASMSSHVTYEYAHGGASPIAIVADPGGTPSACSIDPITGDLAVASVRSSGTTHGKLAVYKGARGTPKLYADASFSDMMFCGYDDAGNLFVDGIAPGSAFLIAELPKGGKALAKVTLDQSILFPGGVQWDGKDLAVGDDRASFVYQFAMSGSNGKKVGATRLKVWPGLHQFFIDNGVLIDPAFLPSRGAVALYDYPAGGKPTRTITGVSSPTSAVVSLAGK
jgi:hypothetical protein